MIVPCLFPCVRRKLEGVLNGLVYPGDEEYDGFRWTGAEKGILVFLSLLQYFFGSRSNCGRRLGLGVYCVGFVHTGNADDSVVVEHA